jgi:hypothetical protein
MSIDGIVYYGIPGGSSHGLSFIEVILYTRDARMTTSESRRLNACISYKIKAFFIRKA